MGKFYFRAHKKAILFSALAICSAISTWGRDDAKTNGATLTKANLSTLTTAKYNMSTEAVKANKGYEQHPEFGRVMPDAPSADCYEVISKRTENTKTYYKNGSNGTELMLQYSTWPMHYKDANGNWLSYNTNLQADKTPGVFSVAAQEVPFTLNTVAGRTTIGKDGHKFSYNNNLELVYVKPDGTEQSLGNANWSNYKAGDNGMYVKNAWPGIDIEITTCRFLNETNFIINAPMPLYANGQLLIRDHMELDGGMAIDVPGKEFKGAIGIINANNEEEYKIQEAVAQEHGENAKPIELNYRIGKNKTLDIVITGNLLNKQASAFPLKIDPIVAYTYAVSAGGSTYSAAWTVGCPTAAAIPINAGMTVTDISYSYSYNAISPCTANYGAFDFFTGACHSPTSNTATKTSNASAVTGVSNFSGSLFADIATCIPAASCSPQTLNITHYLYQKYSSTAACASTYITTAGPLNFTVTGHTAEVATITSSPTGTICAGTCATLTATGNYGVPPYNWQWTTLGNTVGGNATIVACPVPGDTVWIANVYDQCGNTSGTGFIVHMVSNNNPGFNITPDTVCTASNVTVTGNNGLGVVANYNWTLPGSNTPVVSAQQTFTASYPVAGVYNITLTPPNTGGCVFPLTKLVYVTDPPNIVASSSTNPTHCGGADGSILLSGMTNGLSYYVQYTKNATNYNVGPIIASSGSILLPALSAGTYSNIKAVYGSCSSAAGASITLSDPVAPQGNPTTNSPICASQTLNLMSSPSQAPLNFVWSGPTAIANSTSQNGYVPGVAPPIGQPSYTSIYTLTVTNTNTNCSSIATVSATINALPAPLVTPGGPTTFCQGSSVLLTGNSGIGLAFQWNNNGVAISGAGTSSYIATQPGNYTLTETVTATGCTATSAPPITVTVNQSAIVSSGSNSPLCAGGQLQLSSTSNPTPPTVSFTWSGPAGFSSAAQNPTLNGVQPLNSGIYTVSVTNINTSCVATSTVAVTVHSNPTAVVTPLNTALCQGDSVILNGFPAGVTYQWLDNPTLVIPGATSQNHTVYNAGSYKLAVTDGNGCKDTSAVATVTVNPPPTASVTAGGPTTFCDGSSVLLTSHTDIGIGYIWYLDGQPIPNAINNTYAATQSGSYSVEIFSGNGCHQMSPPILITVKPTPVIPVAGNSGPICVGDSLVLTANSITSGATYNWSGPSGYLAAGNHLDIYNAQMSNSGTYSVTATLNGCTSVAGVTTARVYPIPAPPVLSSNSPICPNTTLTLFAADSAQGASFSWLGPNSFASGQQNPVIGSAPIENSGIYTVTASANGCISAPAFLDVTITPIVANVTTAKDTVCQHEILNVNFLGSIWPFATYVWDFDGGTVITGKGTGPYNVKWDISGTKNVTVTVSYNGCTVVGSHKVVVDENIHMTPTTDKDVCIDQVVNFDVAYNHAPTSGWNWSWDFDGATVLNGTGSQGPYVLEWTTPGKKVIRFLTTGKICIDPLMDTVIVHDYPTAQITSASKTNICSGDSISFNAYYVNGYHYAWTPESYFGNSNSNSVTGYVYFPGYVKLMVTDPYGCTNSDSVLINTNSCCTLEFPTAFTPNGDGRNDVFRPINHGHRTVIAFSVSNRWGQVIYNTVNGNDAWDGTFDGVPQDMGVYYWYVKYKCTDGTIMEEKGDVTLMR
jgi:gliding motility-associated-like protein